MNKFLFTVLHKVDLFDHLKIFKEKYFRFGLFKNTFNKRINFYSQFVKRGDLCFDIGANYGNRTEVFLELGAKVLALEPQPLPLKYLRRIFKDNVMVDERAAGEKEGIATLFISNSTSLTSISKEWVDVVSKGRFSKVNWNKSVEVNITTLDNLIKEYGKPDYCKIDVEGFELEVLKGLSQTINLISFEYTIPEFTEKAIDCLTHLSSLGNIVCNYSIGETLQFGLKQWMESEKFVELFKEFPKEGIIDGDIYVMFVSTQ